MENHQKHAASSNAWQRIQAGSKLKLRRAFQNQTLEMQTHAELQNGPEQ